MLAIYGFIAFCQDSNPAANKSSVKFDFAGQVSLGYTKVSGSSNMFLTFGGPGIKIGINKIAVNLGMHPSLKYNTGYNKTTDKTPLAPILGTGVQVSYKHFIAGCMFYSIKNLWYAAPAVGYKFK